MKQIHDQNIYYLKIKPSLATSLYVVFRFLVSEYLPTTLRVHEYEVGGNWMSNRYRKVG